MNPVLKVGLFIVIFPSWALPQTILKRPVAVRHDAAVIDGGQVVGYVLCRHLERESSEELA